MRNVTIKKTIDLALTPEQWGLYNVEEHPSAQAAAFHLNDVVMNCLNNNYSDSYRRAEIASAQRLYRDVGAADTEVNAVIDQLFEMMK